MNILLIGSTGYLGSKLLQRLELEEYNVLSLIRNKSKKINDKVLYINESNVYQQIEKFSPDILIYTACAYENAENNYKNILEANLLFPLELINNVKVKTYIYIGTSLNKFTNIYSLSKCQLSEYGKYHSINNNTNFFNILLESFYGNDEPENRFMKSMIRKLKNNENIDLTDGTQKRDFIYIDDVLEGILKIIKSDMKGYIDIPLGSGESISIKELMEYLKKTLNSKSNLKFGAINSRKNEHSGKADLSIMKEIGFNIKLDMKESIKKFML